MILFKNLYKVFCKNKLNIIFLALLWLLLLITSFYHEPWSDEARAWLIAKQYSFKELLFDELAYEGHPIAWYIPLKLFYSLGLPIYSMQLLALILGMGTTYLIIFYSPFYYITRYLICTSYFIAYQYPIVARSYALLTFSLILLAVLWKKKDTYPKTISLIFGVIINTAFHGALIVAGIILYLLLKLKSTKSVIISAKKHISSISIVMLSIILSLICILPFKGNEVQKIAFEPSFLFSQLRNNLTYSISNNLYLSLIFLLFFIIFLIKNKSLSFFIISFIFLFSFLVVGYSKPWHIGIINIWIIVCFWITLKETSTSTNQLTTKILLLVFNISLVTQTYFSFLSFRYDLTYNYSGAPQMAKFINKHSLNKYSMATNSYNGEAIMPYFKKICFSNWNNGEEPCLFRRKKEAIRTTNIKKMAKWPELYLFARRMDVQNFDFFKKHYQKIIHIDGGMWVGHGIYLSQNYELWCRKDKCPIIKD